LEKPVWFGDIEDANQSVSFRQFSISVQDLQCAVKRVKNWSAPGFDEIHGFWLKKLSALHSSLTELYQRAIHDPPSWLVQGVTHLFIKNISKGPTDVSNYRPITCLSNIWKLLTRIIGDSIYSHFSHNSLFPPNQKGNQRGVWGTKEHLLVDKMIIKDSRHRRTNLAMCWIDYKKAFDSVSHSWILAVLNLYKVAPTIVTFFQKSMTAWKTTYPSSRILSHWYSINQKWNLSG